MKTRIISGIVMGVVVAAVLVLGFTVNPLIITGFVCLCAAGAVWELLFKAAGIKSKSASIGAIVFTVLKIIAEDRYLYEKITVPMYYGSFVPSGIRMVWRILWINAPAILSVCYFIFAAAVILSRHDEFDISRIAVFCAMPYVLAYAFSALTGLIGHQNGIYYFVLLLNFSCVCDMGAYFAGVTLGKHKLCPVISPNKTVEGAVGGIVLSLLGTLIFVLSFGHTDKLVLTLILTIPLCIAGMMGDLFASTIKRNAGLKDYSNLIPGHGGILDRLDSMLFIAPVLYMFAEFGVI